MRAEVALGIKRVAISDYARYFSNSPGPRCSPIFVDLMKPDGGPMGHHRACVAHKVHPDPTPHTHERQVLSTTLQLACEADQPDACHLLSFELVGRRLSLIENVAENAK